MGIDHEPYMTFKGTALIRRELRSALQQMISNPSFPAQKCINVNISNIIHNLFCHSDMLAFFSIISLISSIVFWLIRHYITCCKKTSSSPSEHCRSHCMHHRAKLIFVSSDLPLNLSALLFAVTLHYLHQHWH